MNLPIPSELFTKFNDIKYFDEPHKYYVDDKELISVTTLIHKYQEEFDELYWSEYKANQFNLKQYQIQRAWDFINKKGTIKGSAIHDYTENKFNNKIFNYPITKIINEFGFDPVKIEYEITRKHVDRFYNDVYNRLIPIKTEFVMYDKATQIAGMCDVIFWNVKAQEYQIWDYKTNKELSVENTKKHLLNELYLLQDSDLEIYSLQLQLYKEIIERNTSIKLGKSYIVWFSHNNDNYQIIETKDRKYYVGIIMNNRLEELKAA